jgi:2-oxoglutarate ferredoxin oxidoreductase subunit delta
LVFMQKKKKYNVNLSDEIDYPRGRKSGEVVVIEDRCKGCGFCIANCPRQVLSFSAVFNKKGYHPPEVTNAPKCVNCHFCEVLCPEFAIYSVEFNDRND